MNWFCNLFKPKTLKPTGYPVRESTWVDTLASLVSLGLVGMEKEGEIPDIYFYTTDELNWKSIIPYLTYSAEYYVQTERKDCDDYSKKGSADSSFNFGLNCLQVWGDSPYGFHAFNLVMMADGSWRIFEPNAGFPCAGELMKLNNSYGWIPRKWKS